ncbi:MAG: hypothetical protein JXR73_22480 [Candidatus Omnitrophica bacterium]|nr:hypothetical protein [Candidatus Omnitrophota bacterium]
MKRMRTIFLTLLVLNLIPAAQIGYVQDVYQTLAKPMPANEAAGDRPYEMVRANRTPPRKPLVNFDSLSGWSLQGTNGAVGDLFESQLQRVWDSPVARLVYRGSSNESEITIQPPEPIPLPDNVNALTVWMYGNNWSWVPDPTTPRVDVFILFQNQNGEKTPLNITNVRWKEWWLVHKLLPSSLMDQESISFAGIQIRGCANTEDRELFFEDLVFYQESLDPIQFQPRPKRNIEPFPGQSHGANTGPGTLPFPVREETILPDNYEEDFQTELHGEDHRYTFRYTGKDAVLEYVLDSEKDFFRGIDVRLNGSQTATVWNDGGIKFQGELRDLHLFQISQLDPDVLHSIWKGSVDDREIQIEMNVRLWQKSLVMDVFCLGGEAVELAYGYIANVKNPTLLAQPYLNYGGHHLQVLMSAGEIPFFASVWMDWYRSNASRPYALDQIKEDRVFLNGGVQYLPKTDGKRNDLFERFFITVSPAFEETLPTIANPPAKRGKEAATRLWQESWGPSDYAKEHERSRQLRAYGIKMLTQCNHEITWRDSGESFTFRSYSAPGKGGDEALKQYVADQRSLGWRSGLYTNYCDFAPVNEHWNIDMVMRNSNGDLVTAWPRCYSPKALYAVEKDRELAPIIQKKFNTNAAYTDVHTSVSPWDRCDFDARAPGAGTFASTFYAYGELLLHDQDVYDGHCWSEGNHQWLSAGLCVGNYGLTYSALRLWKEPYLPHFDLLKMHPLSVDIGVPWTSRFFEGKENWNSKEQIEHSIDQFIAATIAYGHIGWLVEETYGIRQTCRSYYMLQQLQSRYAMEKPVRIQYGSPDGLVDSSQALLTGVWKQNRLYIQYENGVEIWINGNPSEVWEVKHNDELFRIPSYGWAAVQGNDFVTGSVLEGNKRFDFVRSLEYVFLDGRGAYRECDGVGSEGSVAVCRAEDRKGLAIFSVEGVKRLSIGAVDRTFEPDDVRSEISRIHQAKAISVEAFNMDGELIYDEGRILTNKDDNGNWNIPMYENAIRYEVRIKE